MTLNEVIKNLSQCARDTGWGDLPTDICIGASADDLHVSTHEGSIIVRRTREESRNPFPVPSLSDLDEEEIRQINFIRRNSGAPLP